MNGQTEPPEVAMDADDDLEAEATCDDASHEGEDDNDDEVSLAKLQAKVDANWDRYLRAAAEVENVRKRAVRDVSQARKYAIESFGRDLLAVVDSLEMGLAAADSANAESLLQGNKATLKLLMTTLERFGVVLLDPEGEPFDPELHQAISMQTSQTVEPGSVLKVIQKGYSLNGRLLRPASVVVAAEPVEDEAGD